MKGWFIGTVCVAAFAGLLSGCQTTDDGKSNDIKLFSGGSGDYTLFHDQGDHLGELVAARKFDEAAKLFVDQRAFFDADPAKFRPLLKQVADQINPKREPALTTAVGSLDKIGWPAPAGRWPAVRETLAAARKAHAGYMAHPLLAADGFRSPEADRLKDHIAATEAKLRGDAVARLAEFDIFGERSFFADYPVRLDDKKVLAGALDALRGRFAAASSRDIARFAAHYPKASWPAGDWRTLGDLHMGALLREAGGSGKADLTGALRALDQTRKAGFEPGKVPGLKIGFVEVTSRSLLKHGQVEFPAEIVVDLPVESTKADLDKVLTSPTASAADYLIVFDVALAKARRRISSTKKVPSRVLVGYRTQPNPAYGMAQTELNQANIESQNAVLNAASVDAQWCDGFGCLAKMFAQVAAGKKKRETRNKVAEAMETLKRTPMTIDVPIYQKYRYDRARVRSAKLMTVHYYVIDRRKKRYFKSTFDVEEKKVFNVAYSVQAEDPNRKSILEKADSDEKVAEWEQAASAVKLSQLVDHYLKHAAKAKPLPSLAQLRQTMLKDKNAALAKYESTRFDARPLNDPRFDSVVVIYSRTKDHASLGSGFFVAPDVVLTNYHVVEGATFVEMKKYDGQETFGKILARDAIRDLAIVKVQSRGKPAQFFTNRTLDLGATTEAIGHPRGLEFSITRGVVSAVRPQRTLNVGGGGGKDVLFIQTDAPISPGNSGGPLFLGDRVVGVNTQGRTEGQNLNFAVHYSEVLDFLNENLPGFSVKAGG